MVRKIIVFATVVLFGAKGANAQSRDTTLIQKPRDATLTFADSLSIFNLIDSLVQFPDAFASASSLVARLGYNSNITSANQSVGLSQFGLSPGISYYHKSGLYVDATAYWSREYSPSLYLTVLSGGYMKTIKKWTLNLEYSRYIYSLSDSAYNSPYTNVVGVSNFFDVKPFLFRLDYSLYFGEKTVHRVQPAIMLNVDKRNWLGFKRILLYPTFSMLLGSESWQDSQYIPYTTNPIEIIYRVHHNLPLYYLQTVTKKEFGILNYAVSLPLSLSLKNWTFLLSYTYNFPQPLPDEQLALTNSGYMSFSIIRYFNFKSPSSLIDFYKMSK